MSPGQAPKGNSSSLAQPASVYMYATAVRGQVRVVKAERRCSGDLKQVLWMKRNEGGGGDPLKIHVRMYGYKGA